MYKVTRKDVLQNDLFLTQIEIPTVANNACPGHYVDVHVNVDTPPLTLPIADCDRERGTITVATGSNDDPSRQLSHLEAGDQVFKVRGPLGGSCTIEALSKVVLVGEGLGVASLLGRARAFKAKEVYTICVIGFDSKETVFWEDEFSAVSDELYVVTEDGTYGVSGKVIGPLRAVCETHHDIERLIVIGGLPIMKRAAKIANDHELPAWMSFDAIRTPVGSPGIFDTADDSQEAFAFARAPEIDADDIDFDKLMAKLKALQKEAQDPTHPQV